MKLSHQDQLYMPDEMAEANRESNDCAADESSESVLQIRTRGEVAGET
jgi:hypothetical protein